MKRLLGMLMALILMVTVNAQNYSGASRFTDNWSIELSSGVQTNLHDHHKPQGAVIDLGLNYQVTPIWGVTGEVGTGINNLANWGTGHVHNGTAFDQLYVFGDVRMNLTNAIAGYNGTPRKWEVEPLAGVGYVHNYSAGDHIPGALLMKTAVNVKYNITDAWAFKMQPAIVWNIDKHKLNSHDAVGQFTVGFVYNFKTSNGNHHMNRAVLYDYDEVNTLRDTIEALEKANKELANRQPDIITRYQKELVPVPIQSQYVVTFAQGSFRLSRQAQETLDAIPTGASVSIMGSASPEGSTEYNRNLSYNRAKAVEAYLKDRNVTSTRTLGVGVDGDESNRLVIVTVQ